MNDENFLKYRKIFEAAAKAVKFERDGFYDGCTGINAVSVYAHQKFGADVYADDMAMAAIRKVMQDY